VPQLLIFRNYYGSLILIHFENAESKLSMTSVFTKYIREYGENVFLTDRSVLYYKLCEIWVSSDRKYIVSQHLKTDKPSRACR